MEFSDENMKIAVAIRAARTAIGWSQQELADKFKVSRPTIARMETLSGPEVFDPHGRNRAGGI
jgi:predicted transcriptional regulator